MNRCILASVTFSSSNLLGSGGGSSSSMILAACTFPVEAICIYLRNFVLSVLWPSFLRFPEVQCHL